MSEHTISVLVFREGDWWVAQCLQADLATQVKSIEDVNYQIERMIAAHVFACDRAGIAPFESLPPAPPVYWRRFEKAQQKLAAITPPRFANAAATPNRAVPNADVRIAA